jgi:hypothetical protein
MIIGNGALPTGLIGPLVVVPGLDLSRSRLSNALKPANHLISSSSDGAQSTNVRLAVIRRNVCSFSSFAAWDLGSGFLNWLDEGWSGDGSGKSESDPEELGRNSRASSTEDSGICRNILVS